MVWMMRATRPPTRRAAAAPPLEMSCTLTSTGRRRSLPVTTATATGLTMVEKARIAPGERPRKKLRSSDRKNDSS